MASRLIFILIAILALSSCMTAHKRAEQANEAGNYDEAMRTYEQIIAQDPSDDDARAGLKKSRRLLLNRLLVQARIFREQSKPDEALLVLNDYAIKQTQWKLESSADSSSAQIQSQEIGFAFQYIEKTCDDGIAAGFPLRALRLLRNNHAIFEVAHRDPLDRLQAKVEGAGRAKCREFLDEDLDRKPALSRLVYRYCRVFHEGVSGIAELVAKDEARYYRTVQSSIEIRALPRDPLLFLGEAINHALTRTGWFDWNGMRVLQFPIGGRFINDHKREPVELTHTYLDHGKTKEYHHNGWNDSQKLELLLLAKVDLHGHPLTLELSAKKEAQGTEHYDNLPAIGLKPQKPEMIDPPTWANEQGLAFARVFQDKATQLWVSLFCHETLGNTGFSSPSDFLRSGEKVAECLRQPLNETHLKYPDFTERWYLKYLGLGVDEAQSILEDDQYR